MLRLLKKHSHLDVQVKEKIKTLFETLKNHVENNFITAVRFVRKMFFWFFSHEKKDLLTSF